MIVLFPMKRDIERFCDSEFQGGLLYPERLCNRIKPQGILEERERKVLSDIERTVLMVNEEVEHLIDIIPYPEIARAFRYENGFTNWRERSHFMKLSLGLINKKVDKDVISVMALMEIFYLSWLLVDEYFDETDKCEEKKAYYKGLANPKSIICIAEAIDTVVSHVFERVSRNKTLGEDGYKLLLNIFSEMRDSVRYGFYLDLEREIVFEKDQNNYKLINDSSSLEENFLAYLIKIEHLRGSQFEAGVKLALALFDDVREDETKSLADIAKNWGILLKMRDDILDIFGDKEGLGREPGEDIIVKGDILKFKMTLPLILWIGQNGKKKIENIIKQISKNSINKDAILAKIKKDQGVLKKCKNYLLKYAGKIENTLRRFEDNSVKLSMIDLLILASRVRM